MPEKQPDGVATGLEPGVLFPALAMARITMQCRAPAIPAVLSGSAWRGAMGWVLQEQCCTAPQWRHECRSCPEHVVCAHYLLFGLESSLPGKQTPPRLYGLRVFRKSGSLCVDLRLFGPAVDLAQTMGQVLASAAGRLRIPERCNIGVRRLDHAGPWPFDRWLAGPPPPPPPWQVSLRTPLRLRKKGRGMTGDDWAGAFVRLAARIEALHLLDNGRPLAPDARAALKQCFARHGLVDHELAWRNFRRRPTAVSRPMPMGGVVGRLLLDPDPPLADFWWAWWRAAALLQLGKGTTMGFGSIALVVPQQ